MSQPSLLTIDVGNSNLTLGVFQGEELVLEKRIETKGCTAESLQSLQDLLHPFALEKGIGCSVVPSLHGLLQEFLVPLFPMDQPFKWVEHKDVEDLGIIIEAENVGIDRLVNFFALSELGEENLILVDMGTATTLDVMNKKKHFLGGVILPGMNLSHQALVKGAEQLPLVDLEAPQQLIGKNTSDALKSGIIFGYAAMVGSLLEEISSEVGVEFKVFATGGLVEKILPYVDSIHKVEKHLTLQGLKTISLSCDSPLMF